MLSLAVRALVIDQYELLLICAVWESLLSFLLFHIRILCMYVAALYIMHAQKGREAVKNAKESNGEVVCNFFRLDAEIFSEVFERSKES